MSKKPMHWSKKLKVTVANLETENETLKAALVESNGTLKYVEEETKKLETKMTVALGKEETKSTIPDLKSAFQKLSLLTDELITKTIINSTESIQTEENTTINHQICSTPINNMASNFTFSVESPNLNFTTDLVDETPIPNPFCFSE
ncbi:Uncharacterized protein APZ42_014440 [Daphnia magna]|uniref:Uncharacterized protein n=1 Tax=Daphnia magna TaxID=35525 RepID=A0A162PW52_9CRUS|nr:Uncharacterized protein APZ42_014440 [Daphnia magna]